MISLQGEVTCSRWVTLGRVSLICLPSMPLVCVVIPLCLLTADSLPPCRGRRGGGGEFCSLIDEDVCQACENGGRMSTPPACPSWGSALPPHSHSELLCGSVGVAEEGVRPRQVEACQHLSLLVEFVRNGNAVWKGQEPAASCLWWTKGFCLPRELVFQPLAPKVWGRG